MIIAEIIAPNLDKKLEYLVQSLGYFAPEIVLAILFLVLLILDARKKSFSVNFWFGLFITSLGIVLLTLFQQETMLSRYFKLDVESTLPSYFPIFLNLLHLDFLAIYLKFLFLIAGVFTILISPKTTFFIKDNHSFTGPYLMLLTAMILGLNLMVMSANWLMIYLSIETVSITSYILTFFHFNKKGAEGSIKYLVFGAVASGTMLYGISWWYGLTGVLDLSAVNLQNEVLQNSLLNKPFLLSFALFFILVGFLFKIAIVPFHFWTPDIYEAAPSPIVAFFSVAPKAAGLVILYRVLEMLMPLNKPEIWLDVQAILALLAMLTLFVGNLAALWQNNSKRLLAYSSVAQAGFMLVGLVSFTDLGLQSILFYLFAYLLMNFGAFLLIEMLTFAIQKSENQYDIRHYKGLGRKYPFLGVIFLILMIALTGLPPTVGFTGKLFIFSSLWEGYQIFQKPILWYLLIIGIFNTAISLVYYLKIPFYMFFFESDNSEKVNFPIFQKIILFLFSSLLILFFLQPNWLMNFLEL